MKHLIMKKMKILNRNKLYKYIKKRISEIIFSFVIFLSVLLISLNFFDIININPYLTVLPLLIYLIVAIICIAWIIFHDKKIK